MVGAADWELEAEARRLNFETVEAYLNFSFIHGKRILKYPEQRPGVTVGLSNVHQMTGQVN